MSIAPARLHHIALTVRDFEVSVPWYEGVFGVTYRMDVPHEGGNAKLLTDDSWELSFALHVHDTSEGETFVETRTGLDHVGFVVPIRDDLIVWQSHLESHGVERAGAADKPLTQSEISDQPYGAVLVFRDPDNIQLELFSPAAAH